MTLQQALEVALHHHQAGRLEQAGAIYKQVLSQQPNHPDALHLLGMVYYSAGDMGAASELIQRAIRVAPTAVDYHNNLGLVYTGQKRHDLAEAEYRSALQLKSDSFDAHFGLGVALYHQNRFDEAIEAYDKAIGLNPQSADTHNNLANALRDKGQLRQAIVHYEYAAKLEPRDAEILSNLGAALPAMNELDRAIEILRQAVSIRSDHVDAWVNLGNALKDQAHLIEAITCYRRAVELAPHRPAIHSNVISAMHYEPSCTPQDVQRELMHWRKLHAEPRRPSIRPHTNSPDPDRRLRIGYVSADFFDHASAFFFVPLLKGHDSRDFEVTCYANVARPDACTATMQRYPSGWKSIYGMTDDQVAQIIREDRIDILVDAKIHTAENSLPVFARKPAPIQVTWLGYPGSTGLDTMDYRFTDRFLDPPGLNDSLYSEQSVRLPNSFWCYDSLASEPAVLESPVEQSGWITFGCLNNFCKVNEKIVRLWSRLMHEVADSRLLLLTPFGKHRDQLIEQLNVAPQRVEFAERLPRVEYLRLYNRIDIVLDTFPYNGHTTSFDALWMGVPLVSLSGQTAVSRGGLSLLSNLGIPELAAKTDDEYVNIARDLVNDRQRLAELRRTLRRRMEASPLMDGPRFARDFETAFRTMWRKWCADAPSRALP